MRFHDLLQKPKKLKESKTQKPANAKSYEQQLQEKLKESMGIK